MRNAVRMCAVLLLIGAAGLAAVAQDAPRRGMGGFMRSSGDTISDVLVLTDEQAEKVAEASQQAMEASREGIDFQGMRDMSTEERQEAFTKMNEKYAAAMTEKLKPILSEQQLKDIEPFLSMRGIRARADLRALRQLDLKDEQRKELAPLTLAFAKVVLEERQQQQGGGFGGPQEDSEKVTKANEEFQAGAAKVLSAEQNEAWKKKTEEVQAEMQRQREQMRQGRGQ